MAFCGRNEICKTILKLGAQIIMTKSIRHRRQEPPWTDHWTHHGLWPLPWSNHGAL